LEEAGLNSILSMVFTTNANKQYGYDHRFDNSLYLNEEFVTKMDELQKEAAQKCGDFLSVYAGPVYFDPFGEKPFAPKSKTACLKLSAEQQKLSQKMNMGFRQIREQYNPRSKSSFCIVGFPLPEIGEHFEGIFEETIVINMMDTIKHEAIQQCIVDALDNADFVHVKGKNGNLTDIKVKMHKIDDPAKQTNFVNCGADVNIPVGEVFTSPVLKDTNGILHLKETFLKGLKFTDLNLKFKDGYVEEYSCGNFEKEEENKKYIEENLLFPHKTLPIGEFAIGTNTKAYVMAQKFDILPLLPVLIVEKMGPHFAIGDTCFSWEEDFAVYNPIDNKEIIARDNERSALRKEDINKAYTNCHTDITLPYEDLDFITAISESGKKFDIIRDGRFVVPGSEELNIPLDM
jgi:aminopeptidase